MSQQTDFQLGYNKAIGDAVHSLEMQAAILRDTAVRLGEVAADATTISLHDQAANELEIAIVAIRTLKI